MSSVENDPDKCESPDEFKEEDDLVKNPPHIRSLTAYERAKNVIENKKIFFVLEKGAFEVKGTNGVPYTVELFPKRNCTCACNGVCYHILACQMALKISNTETKRPGNTALLRRTLRRRIEKASGRKKPRPRDIRSREHVDNRPDDNYYEAFEPDDSEDYLLKKDTKQKFYIKKKSTLDKPELDLVPPIAQPPSLIPFAQEEVKLKACIKKRSFAESETDSSKFVMQSSIKRNKVTENESFSSSVRTADSREKVCANTNMADQSLEQKIAEIDLDGYERQPYADEFMENTEPSHSLSHQHPTLLGVTPLVPLDLPDPSFNSIDIESLCSLQDESNRRVADSCELVFSQSSNQVHILNTNIFQLN